MIDAKLKKLLDVIDDGIIFLNKELTVTDASKSISKFSLQNSSNIIGRNYLDILRSNQFSETEINKIISFLKNSSMKSRSLQTYYGTEFYIEMLSIVNNSASWIIAYKKKQDVLSYLKYISSVMPGYFYWKNKEGIYLGCNQALLDTLGFTESDLVNKTDYDFWPRQADSLRNHDLRVMESGSLLRLEEEIEIEGVGKRYYTVVKMPLYNENHEIIGIVGNSLDITDQIQTKNKLEKAKKSAEAANKAKSEFIANMSHDIRTPITGMLGLTQSLLNTSSDLLTKLTQQTAVNNKALNLKSLLQEFAQTTQNDSELLLGATDELLQLCNEILEIVKLENESPSEIESAFALKEIIQHNIELLRPVAKHKNLQLSFSIDPKTPKYLKGFYRFYDRILLNLISNALKFTQHGFVKVSIGIESRSDKSKLDNNQILLRTEIEDSGIGIPEDKFEVIFEHFSRLTSSYEGLYRGSGLGLYTVKRYVEAMGGKIELTSIVNKGTTFTLLLPFTIADYSDQVKTPYRLTQPFINTEQVAAIPSTEKHIDSQPTQTSCTVLVVEDNVLAARALEANLKSLNCRVDIAQTGAEAMTKLENNHYDLVLMDIGLPDMSGIEVTQKIRRLSGSQKSEVPIVAVSGHANNLSMRQKSFEAGMQDIVNKPASPLVLESVIEKYVFKATDQETTAAPPALQSDKVIDWQACVQMHQGDVKFTKQLLSMFVADLKATEDKLEKFYLAQDEASLRDLLHHVIGGICYLRLPQLENALRQFHKTVKTASNDSDKMESTYQNLQQAIRQFWEVWNTHSSF